TRPEARGARAARAAAAHGGRARAEDRRPALLRLPAPLRRLQGGAGEAPGPIGRREKGRRIGPCGRAGPVRRRARRDPSPARDHEDVVKNDPTFWLLARASGLTAYALLTASVLAGLVLKARPFRSLKPAAVTDTHRFLALLGLGAIALHGVALLFD